MKNCTWSSSLLLLLAGGLSSFGFAPFYWWPFTVACLVYLVIQLQQTDNVRRACGLGFVFGLGHFLAGLYWIPRAFWQESGSWAFAIGGGVPALLALAAFCALFVVLVAGGFTYGRRYLPKVAWPLLFAVLWVAAEWVRAHLLWGFPWNLIGYVWADNVPLLQLAAVGEVWLMSFVLVLLAAALAAGLWWRVVSVLLVVVLIIWGQLRVTHADVTPLPVEVALIDGQIEEMTGWTMADRWQQMIYYANKTAQEAGAADIIVWPETAVMFDIQRDAFARQTLAGLLQPQQTLVIGTPWMEDDGKIYNAIVTLNAQGQVLSKYFKHNLVPFGEFVPLRKYIPNVWEIGRFVRQYQDYSAGDGNAYMELGHNITALPLVCYEAIFPSYVHRQKNETDVLLNITNDAWFKNTTAPYQHFAMARVRAVAAGKPMLRVANMGVTVKVDKYGRIVLTSN